MHKSSESSLLDTTACRIYIIKGSFVGYTKRPRSSKSQCTVSFHSNNCTCWPMHVSLLGMLSLIIFSLAWPCCLRFLFRNIFHCLPIHKPCTLFTQRKPKYLEMMATYSPLLPTTPPSISLGSRMKVVKYSTIHSLCPAGTQSSLQTKLNGAIMSHPPTAPSAANPSGHLAHPGACG